MSWLGDACPSHAGARDRKGRRPCPPREFGGIITGKIWIYYIINHAFSRVCKETRDNGANMGGRSICCPNQIIGPPSLPPGFGAYGGDGVFVSDS